MIEIKSGDYGFDISFTVTESDGVTARDLTDCVVTFKVWDTGNLILEGTCDVDSAEDGTCHYTVQKGDFEIPENINYRDYNCEIELNYEGIVISTKTETLRVYASV